MSDEAREWSAPTWATFNLTDVDTEEPYTIKASTVTVRLLAELIEKWGIGQAQELLLFGASLVKKETSERDVERLRLILEAVHRSPIGQAEDLEDHVLWRSYTWLLEKQINRKQAARYASDVLGREISTDTWRKRVDRWAEKQHFPRVEIYKRGEPDV
jgi:hypothetical protein